MNKDKLIEIINKIILTIFIVVPELSILYIVKEDIRRIVVFLLICIINLVFIMFGVIQARVKKQLEISRNNFKEQQDKNAMLIDNLPEAIICVNRKGDILLANSASTKLLSSRKNIVGRKISRVVQLTNLSTNEKFSFHNVFKLKKRFISYNNLTLNFGGDVIRVEVEILAMNFNSTDDEQSLNYAVIMRDITKQKTLDEERDEFISVVSHELRTPVAIAEGAISNLNLMVNKDVPKNSLVKSIKTAHREVSFLANMVNDLSTLSRAENSTCNNLENVDPEKIGHELYNKYVSMAKDRGLSLNLHLSPELPQVQTNKLYLEELLQNIITNAFKYTKSGSVSISVEKSPKAVMFAITDTGIGISRSDQDRIFEKFYRSEDYRTRETGGTGLGLYVASKLARKINTRIFVNSRLNHGSIFWFEIPIKYNED